MHVQLPLDVWKLFPCLQCLRLLILHRLLLHLHWILLLSELLLLLPVEVRLQLLLLLLLLLPGRMLCH